MLSIDKTFFYISIILIMNLSFSGCSIYNDEIKKTDTIKKEKVTISSMLTPLQKCNKEESKYNLIVNAPNNSRVRILNIKPIYKDCISLQRGMYHIEVQKDGFEKYKKWITIDKDTELTVNLTKIEDTSAAELEKAGYDKRALNSFIKKYPRSDKALIARNRLGVIKYKFKNYSPKGLIKSNKCIGFYPKSLVERKLNIETTLEYWNSIEWSGGCKKGLMTGRGILSFKSLNSIEIELKGKMRDGFFEGKVYNHSKTKDYDSSVNSGKEYDIVKLKNRFDFMHYNSK